AIALFSHYYSVLSFILALVFSFFFFFFNATAPPEIYTLSLHDALPIYPLLPGFARWLLRLVTGDLGSSFRDGRAVSAVLGEALRSEEHTSELQSQSNLVCRLLLEKKKKK